MPVYQYLNKRDGSTLELVKPVADRDAVPEHLQRITVPQRVAVHGTTSSPICEQTADHQVPRALRSLSNNQVNDMVKESGLSRDKFKRVWNMIALLVAILVLPARATDISTGYAFSSGEPNVTHTKLNNAVNLATINTGFYTDKSASTTPAATDLALIYSVSDTAFRKVTLANLFLANAALITGQTEDTTPAAADYVLTYDVSATGLKKATLLNAVFENAALIPSRTIENAPAKDMFFLGYDGDWNKVARSNLWYQHWYYRSSDFTNLTVHTAPTNSDALVLWDSLSGTNRQIPLINLFSNANRVTYSDPTNVITTIAGTDGTNLSTITKSDFLSRGLPSGFPVQTVTASDGTFTTVATAIPYDDSIPQNSEGGEILTLAITPKAATSKLVIQAVAYLEIGNNSAVAALALFQDSVASALAVAASSETLDETGGADTGALLNPTVLHYSMVAGTTSATTFKLRVGANAGSVQVNGSGGARKYGGVLKTFMSVTEVAQ